MVIAPSWASSGGERSKSSHPLAAQTVMASVNHGRRLAPRFATQPLRVVETAAVGKSQLVGRATLRLRRSHGRFHQSRPLVPVPVISSRSSSSGGRDAPLISFQLTGIVDDLGDLLGDVVDAELVGTHRNLIGE